MCTAAVKIINEKPIQRKGNTFVFSTESVLIPPKIEL